MDRRALLQALGHTVELLGMTTRGDQILDRTLSKVGGKGLFVKELETALEEGEIVTEVAFPVPEKAAYIKFQNPASRYAMVGVFVAKTKAGVRVAVTGAGSCVFRESAMEAALANHAR